MTAVSTSTPLAALLAERIRARGPIPFAEYMDACLYHPEHGYYSRPETQRFADYYTSPDVHPIFGRLLARQLEEMWRALGAPAEFTVVEAGVGCGLLAGQILDFSGRALPEFYDSLCYVAVERSVVRRAQAEKQLNTRARAGRVTFCAELPDRIAVGCILSNELFDALPVHRVAVNGGTLREIYVTLEDGRFVEQLGPPSTPRIADYFAAQGVTLSESQQAEAGLAACDWIENAGKRLGRGFVITIDYGHPAEELYSPWHMRGTLMAYRQHRANEGFYDAPGEQDLTAHVNFTALELWGQRGGLETTGLVPQSRFLLALGRGNDFADLYEPGQGEAVRVRARLQLKTLIFPEGMGETFQVLVQHKGIAAPNLTGLAVL